MAIQVEGDPVGPVKQRTMLQESASIQNILHCGGDLCIQLWKMVHTFDHGVITLTTIKHSYNFIRQIRCRTCSPGGNNHMYHPVKRIRVFSSDLKAGSVVPISKQLLWTRSSDTSIWVIWISWPAAIAESCRGAKACVNTSHRLVC